MAKLKSLFTEWNDSVAQFLVNSAIGLLIVFVLGTLTTIIGV